MSKGYEKAISRRYEQAKIFTEKYGKQLLPCAKCGRTDIHICTDRTIFPKPKNVWFAACPTPYCDCTESFTSIKKVIERWNNKQKAKNTE